jgi:hypothetical protein
MFVSDFQQISGFLRVFNKTNCHTITEILFKVALNTIKQTLLRFLISLFGIFQLFSVAGYDCTATIEYITLKAKGMNRTRPT